ncbi:MAG: ornithine cyclodeaminase/alanine dehydrogenase-like protein (mu-crystallin family) [Parasphingorhabdus sp.]
MIRYLSRNNVEHLGVNGSMLANRIEQTIVASANGAVENLPKSAVQLEDGRLFQSIMAVGKSSPAPPYAATKVVGLSPDNHQKGLPHIGSVIVLLDRSTGLPLCIMDGSWITETRTAALSLIVARRFARPDAQCIGFVACGAQARSHLAVLKKEFPLTKVTAFSRNVKTAESFATWVREQGLEAIVTEDPMKAVAAQDIVVSSVPQGSAPMGFLQAQWLEPGAFATLVDLGRSWSEDGFLAIESKIVDNRLLAEKAQKTRPFTPSGPYTQDLEELITKSGSGNHSSNQRAVFVFQGIALADLAAAALVFEKAVEANAGTQLES